MLSKSDSRALADLFICPSVDASKRGAASACESTRLYADQQHGPLALPTFVYTCPGLAGALLLALTMIFFNNQVAIA